MIKFFTALGAGVVDVPLRPLLYTAGAAATTAGIYYYVKQGDGKTTTSDPEVTTEDPVCDRPTEPALLQPTEVPQDQLTDAVTEAEEKIQKLVGSNTQLQESVRELEELLWEARRDDMKSKALQAEAEEKHQKAEETITQLEVEKSDLTKQVETLQETVQNLGNLLSETHRECDTLLMNECERDQEAHSILQAENKKMKKTLMDKEELLKVFLIEAEEKHQKALETIAQLEVDKSALTKQVETLQDMWILLGEAHRECDKLKAEESTLSQLEVVKSDQKDQVSHAIVQNMEHLLTAFILIFFLLLFFIRTKCLSTTT